LIEGFEDLMVGVEEFTICSLWQWAGRHGRVVGGGGAIAPLAQCILACRRFRRRF
jgi:hypothetical protein